MISTAVYLAPYSGDLLSTAAERLCRRWADQLPNLSHVQVLIPTLHAAPALRAAFLACAVRHGHSALLGPRITSLSAWVQDTLIDPATLLGREAAELELAAALRQHPKLLNGTNPWPLAASLYALFDELERHGATLPETLAACTQTLARAYGTGTRMPHALGEEARLVHTLWRAWRRDQTAERQHDPARAYAAALARHAASTDRTFFLLVGYDELDGAARRWLQQLYARDQAELVLYGDTTDAVVTTFCARLGIPTHTVEAPECAYAQCLSSVWQREPAFAERVRQTAARHPETPLTGRLAVLAAQDEEQEAEAVDLQLRLWLAAGKQRIALITADRRLARRVRALLERAGVALADTDGWALSTARAAAVVERWLHVLEEDFAHAPLLDMLKSPLVFGDQDEIARLATVYHFEQDVVRGYDVARGMKSYRAALAHKARTQPHWGTQHYAPMTAVLDAVEYAAAPLIKLKRASAHQWLHALETSLARLGLLQACATDDAGRVLIESLRRLDADLAGLPTQLEWDEWRLFLARMLEHLRFTLPSAQPAVWLLDLGHAGLMPLDAALIAGADREHLPGRMTDTPYFNQAVRAELGLPTACDLRALTQRRLRRALSTAGAVLITYPATRTSGPNAPSPWIEGLVAFHRAAYGDDLAPLTLAQWVQAGDTPIVDRSAPCPAPMAPPSAPAARIPATYSVRMHQALIDCPYQFFAAACLGLTPLREVRPTLEKADYGERVHRCLEAFHAGAKNLPGPYREPFDATHRNAAIACLTEISHAVFHADVTQHFEHRAWLTRWLALIPAYIDWQIERATEWRVVAVEQRTERRLASNLTLRGRLDRIDQGRHGLAILDYKTGTPPHADEVLAGEAVQLPSYTLLQEGIVQAGYLHLDRERVAAKTLVEGAALTTLTEAVRARLVSLATRLAADVPLPAWGDTTTCNRCDYAGLCRRGTWIDSLTSQGSSE